MASDHVTLSKMHSFRLRSSLAIALFVLSSAYSFRAWSQTSSMPQPEDLHLIYEKDLTRAHFSLGAEMTNLSSSTAAMMGVGPRGGFEYGLTEKWSLGTNLLFAFQATGKAGAFFYSGITGFGRYAFEGNSVKVSTSINKKDGVPVYSARPSLQKRKTVIFGVEQLFLNGVASIYPAVGPTIGGSWGFVIWGHETEFDIRYSKLMANDNPIEMIAVGTNINLGF